MRKQLLFVSLAAFTAIAGFSRDFIYQDVTYTVLDETEATCETKAGVEYVSGGNTVSGVLVLPANPKDGDKEYKLVKIGDYGFYSNYDITSVIIPEGVTNIGNAAFKTCVASTSFVLPSTLKQIGEYAFSTCVKATEFSLPESLESIGRFAFQECVGLEKITLPSGMKAISNQVFDSCTKLVEVKLPENCETIGNYAFFNCTALKDIRIPDAVTYIGLSAFADCKALENVTLGRSVETIDENAFYNNQALTEMVLPNSVTTLNDQAFRNTGIKIFKIGKGLKLIGEEVFSGTTVKEMYITAQKPPTVAASAFTNYGDLYVEGDNAAIAYEANSTWGRFEIETMEDPDAINGETNIVCEPGKSIQLTATIIPETIELPYIYWSSADTSLATVDANGLVTVAADANPEAEVKITATTLYALLADKVYTVKFKAGEVGPGEDPEPETHLYDALQKTETECDWTFVNEQLPEDLSYVWSWKSYKDEYYLNGSAYVGGVAYPAIAYAVSPVVDLTDYEELTAGWQQAARYQTTIKELGRFCVREEGTEEWTEYAIEEWPEAGAWTWGDAKVIDLNDWSGKKVNFAFKYESATEGADTWEIRNFWVDGKEKTTVDPDPIGVEGIGNDTVAPAYYDLCGRKVANPANGLYIKVLSGKAEKVIL